MKTEILDYKKGGDESITLSQVLTLLTPHLPASGWHILEFNVLTDGTVRLDEVMERSRNVRAMGGFALSEIFRIASALRDEVWMTVAVPKDDRCVLEDCHEGGVRYEDCAIAIECIDGWIWSIGADDPAIHELLADRYRDREVRLIDDTGRAVSPSGLRRLWRAVRSAMGLK